MHPTLTQTYLQRAEDPTLTPLATYLLRLIHYKRTNLCVSADVTSPAELLKLAEDVGDQICVLKTHADVVKGFSERTMKSLTDIARRKRFVLFEDRKFMDIGSTVRLQYTEGNHAIVRWAPIVNAALFSGDSIIRDLADAAKKAIASHNTSVQTEISASPAPSDAGNDVQSPDDEDDEDDDHDEKSEDSEDEDDEDPRHEPSDHRNGRKQSVVSVSTTISTKTETISPQPSLRPSISRESTEEDIEEEPEEDPEAALESLGPPPFYRAMLILAEMSSSNNQFTPQHTEYCVKAARANKDFVMGFIAQRSLNREQTDNFITMTPGVQLSAGGDGHQQYNTPRKVIGDTGCDVMIVGRGILQAQDRRRAALDYRKQGWTAYEERLRAGRRRR